MPVSGPVTLHGFSPAKRKDKAVVDKKLGSLIVPILQKRKLSLQEVNLSSWVGHMVTKCGAWSQAQASCRWNGLMTLLVAALF